MNDVFTQMINIAYVYMKNCFPIMTFVCLSVCFVALRPKPTAMVMAERSVYLTTLCPGQA